MKDERFSKILLIDNDEVNAKAVTKILSKQQYQVEHSYFGRFSLLKQVNELSPDIIVLKVDSLHRDLIESFYQIADFNPKPMVVFSPIDDVNSIKSVIKSGVSAYTVGEIEAERLEHVIDVAIVRFLEEQRLKSELEQAKLRLSNQKTLERAKIWLMENNQITEKDAYHHMRKIAMDEGDKIEKVAEDLLSKIRHLKA
ncbi:ANTAR domain-containing response regulator [Alteromonas sp. a30]|uniref:ANTAR domain-containing response regulator n=1 Tax=Alteromonas sp. a30 TaxID=2730917 RepID=UPI0022822CCD|nr:ANTAR domain-containing protein [Alteromonas sp. a30]MCY7294904.1 ANTAR domain-containing protein [Alteromonas sp. a30]